ncbi:hypothetical protein D3OALGA1CA_5343 [Olavius algarvensis associated proteobacterium Delta 3]|nr:hypothetical protein D3OALGA1CA_5343 [Olavius algarvensis associated proteobacterium Delta 3]
MTEKHRVPKGERFVSTVLLALLPLGGLVFALIASGSGWSWSFFGALVFWIGCVFGLCDLIVSSILKRI